MSRVLPFGLAHIPRLTYLYLDHNQFSGRIPDTFYKHPFLKEMNIEGNSFRPGVKPIVFGRLVKVTKQLGMLMGIIRCAMKERKMCNVVCHLTLDAKTAKEYRVNMILDNLPLVVPIPRPEQERPSNLSTCFSYLGYCILSK